MMKLIKLVLYFLVWLPVTVIYAFLSALCNHPKRGWWWVNYSFFIFLFLLLGFYATFESGDRFALERLQNSHGFQGTFISSFLLAIFGTPLLFILFSNKPPYGRLKAFYRKLFPIRPPISKVKIASKTNGSENLESITSRLAPHLQELIARR